MAKAGLGNPDVLATIAWVAVWAFAIIIAVNQIGVASTPVNTLRMGTVAAIALAVGLAIGLGGRETAGQIVADWYRQGQQAAPRAAAAVLRKGDTLNLEPDDPTSDATRQDGAPAGAAGQTTEASITGGETSARWEGAMPAYRTSAQARAGEPAARWEELLPAYRARWCRRVGWTDARWEDAEPHYRYGWALATSQRYHDLEWGDVESQVRRDWRQRHPDTPWDHAAEDIRDAWDVPPLAG